MWRAWAEAAAKPGQKLRAGTAVEAQAVVEAVEREVTEGQVRASEALAAEYLSATVAEVRIPQVCVPVERASAEAVHLSFRAGLSPLQVSEVRGSPGHPAAPSAHY